MLFLRPADVALPASIQTDIAQIWQQNGNERCAVCRGGMLTKLALAGGGSGFASLGWPAGNNRVQRAYGFAMAVRWCAGNTSAGAQY